MKSIKQKFSLLLLVSTVIFLSSCLDSGSQSIIGTQEPSYITSGMMGTTYARTQRGYLITGPQIQTLTPGRIALLSYQITEESEQVTVEDGIIASKVQLSREPEILDQTDLMMLEAPEEENPLNFETIREPLYAPNEYFGDRWIFSYTYKAKKGENFSAKFYLASEEDAEAADSDVLIDVRLEKSGTSESGAAEKIEGQNLVVDMSYIRAAMSNKVNANNKLYIKFRYYRSDNQDIFVTHKNYEMHFPESDI